MVLRACSWVVLKADNCVALSWPSWVGLSAPHCPVDRAASCVTLNPAMPNADIALIWAAFRSATWLVVNSLVVTALRPAICVAVSAAIWA